MRPEDVTARDVYAYRHEREPVGKVTANHELSVLKHVFTKAVEWGVLDLNLARNVRKFSVQRRSRDVTDREDRQGAADRVVRRPARRHQPG